jgi:class 3 adenylate cyclase
MDIFGSNSGEGRWIGVLATQTVNAAVTSAALVGVNYWRANVLSPADSLTVDDLFSELHVTGYYATNWSMTSRPTAVTKGATPTVTHSAHGFSSGQEVKFIVFDGMTELDGLFATVTVVNSNSYTIDIDTTSFTTWVSSDRNYVEKAEIFRLMDASTQANIDEAATYPTKYTLFDSKIATAMQTGSASWTGGSITLPYSVDNLESVRWPAQKTIADNNGLDLCQYEGTNHLIGDNYLAGFGGQSQFTEFLTRTSHSAARAVVQREAFDAFLRVGGKFPSQFVDMGYPGPNNTWGGIRYFPGDEGNPTFQVALDFNKNKKMVTVTT